MFVNKVLPKKMSFRLLTGKRKGWEKIFDGVFKGVCSGYLLSW